MDVSMPKMGGIEATQLIRSWEVEKDKRYIPIIALTAHAMIGDRERILQAGMDEYVFRLTDQQALTDTSKIHHQAPEQNSPSSDDWPCDTGAQEHAMTRIIK